MNIRKKPIMTLDLFVSRSWFMLNASREQFYGSLVLSCKFLPVLGVDVVFYCKNKSLMVSCSALLLFVFLILLDTLQSHFCTISFPLSSFIYRAGANCKLVACVIRAWFFTPLLLFWTIGPQFKTNNFFM